MQRFSLGFLLLCLVAAGPLRAQAGEVPASGLACELPADLTTPSDPLTEVANALTTKGRLDILALGSGFAVGDAGASGGSALAYHVPGGSFPYKMLEALEAMRPKLHFQLTVKGARSMTADAMLTVLEQELATHHYDLVLWQTGTVEAVHGVRPEALREVLQTGADAIAQAHADLVLIDPQFSRFLRANTDISPYETVLQQMTVNPGVTLFHRLDLTQTWIDNGQIDLERASKEERDKVVMLLNTCLGQALARYVLAGASEH